MENSARKILAWMLLLIITAIAGLFLAFPIKWAWNATIPEIFGLIEITWGQAWCLNFLSACLIQSGLSHNSDAA